MNRLAVILGLVLCVAPIAVLAQEATPPPGLVTSGNGTYKDPAMIYTGPAGYVQVPLPPPKDPTDFGQTTVVAGWVKNPGQQNQIAIRLSMESFNGNLDGFEMVSENELRNASDGVFVKSKSRTHLANGMPAYFQDITVGSGFQTTKIYQLLWVDGVRGVTLSVQSHLGTIDPASAEKLLVTAVATAFPQRDY